MKPLYPPGTKVKARIHGTVTMKTLGEYVYTVDKDNYYQVLDKRGERSSITSDIVRPAEILEVLA